MTGLVRYYVKAKTNPAAIGLMSVFFSERQPQGLRVAFALIYLMPVKQKKITINCRISLPDLLRSVKANECDFAMLCDYGRCLSLPIKLKCLFLNIVDILQIF